jgi:hypothetical protein
LSFVHVELKFELLVVVLEDPSVFSVVLVVEARGGGFATVVVFLPVLSVVSDFMLSFAVVPDVTVDFVFDGENVFDVVVGFCVVVQRFASKLLALQKLTPAHTTPSQSQVAAFRTPF